MIKCMEKSELKIDFADKREKKNEIERFNVPLLCLDSAVVASIMPMRGIGD